MLLAGLPGCGKSTVARRLEQCGWLLLTGDEAASWSNEAAVAWEDSWKRETDSRLRSMAPAKAEGIVVEWGVPAHHLQTARRMKARGWEVWFFDCDDATALARWQTAHPGEDRSRPRGIPR
jgi:broad-specificity NMP kinase